MQHTDTALQHTDTARDWRRDVLNIKVAGTYTFHLAKTTTYREYRSKKIEVEADSMYAALLKAHEQLKLANILRSRKSKPYDTLCMDVPIAFKHYPSLSPLIMALNEATGSVFRTLYFNVVEEGVIINYHLLSP